MAKVSTKVGAGMLAALGLSALSPVQQAGVALSVGVAALWATPALASINLPGVGVVVKKKPGNAPIVVPSDANGEVRISGLEPGEYEIAPLRLTAAAPVRNTSITVGKDGILAFAVRKGPKGASGSGRAIAAPGGVWIEPIPELGRGSGVIVAILAGSSIALPDVNNASAEQLARGTGTSMQSAVHIVAMREKGGRYVSIEDFARRNCPTMAIDMSQGQVQIGDLRVVLGTAAGRGTVPGFQCGPGGGEQFSLYGQRHNYVGHVTLLR